MRPNWLSRRQYVVVAEGERRSDLVAVSVAAPLGRALLGHRRGETIEVRTPAGKRLVTITAVHRQD